VGTARTRVVEERAMQAIEELEKGLEHLSKARDALQQQMPSYWGAGAYAMIAHVIGTVKRIMQLLGQHKEEPCNKP